MKRLLIFLQVCAMLLLAGCASVSSQRSAPLAPPQNIALLVPLSGGLSTYGTAIRNGFFTAYYAEKDATGYSPVITVYDTNGQTIQSLYQKAVQEGANFVVGPLNKAEVATLIKMPSITIPVLALNETEGATN